MKKLFLAILILISTSVFADVYVKGYTKKNGTYVQPHYRSNPDGNIYNNWSTQGNVNPYTGKAGTVNPYTVDNYNRQPLKIYVPQNTNQRRLYK